MSAVERRPWPRDERFLVGADGSVIGPRGDLIGGSPNGDGYCRITTRSAAGRRESHGVHVLVAETWIGPRPSARHQVAHGNGVRSDNRVENLCWKTARGNAADKLTHGTNGRLSVDDVRAIRAAAGETSTSVANRYPVTPSQVRHIRGGRSWAGLVGDAS